MIDHPARCEAIDPTTGYRCQSDGRYEHVHAAIEGRVYAEWGEPPPMPEVLQVPQARARRRDPISSHDSAHRGWDDLRPGVTLELLNVMHLDTGREWVNATETEALYRRRYGDPPTTSNRGFQVQDRLLTLHRMGFLDRQGTNPLTYRYAGEGEGVCYDDRCHHD